MNKVWGVLFKRVAFNGNNIVKKSVFEYLLVFLKDWICGSIPWVLIIAYVVCLIFNEHESYQDWIIPEGKLFPILVLVWMVIKFFPVLFKRIESHIELQDTLEKERKEFKDTLSKKDACIKELELKKHKGNFLEKLIKDVGNLFSPTFARNMYQEVRSGNFYSSYRAELASIKADAIGLLPNQDTLKDLLIKMDNELEEIEKESVIPTILNSNIDLVQNFQKKHLDEFYKVKSEFLENLNFLKNISNFS